MHFNKTTVLLVVGLTRSMLGEHSPNLTALARRSGVCDVMPAFPALTCSAQSSILTGLPVSGHGVVANGWYERDWDELRFWKQSNRIVQGEKLWQRLKRIDPSFVGANLFWWFNMASEVDISLTPRPMYPADGRKLPDVYSQPADLRERYQQRFGQFPLFEFWGPRAGIGSSAWIAQAAMAVEAEFQPDLNLVYLPHLDYALQQFGPDDPRVLPEIAAIDALVGELMDAADAAGRRLLVLSEYAIEAVDKPVALNRVLREAGWLAVRRELGRELLDTGASAAFAVADHQIAHVYLRDPSMQSAVAERLAAVDGVESVWDRQQQAAMGVAHARSGDLLCVAEPGAWFSYYYWLDDAVAPDFARTVDIHRKPGYDPVELFLDPALRWPTWSVGWRLLRKKLGFRGLLDVIALDGSLVRGSHGRVDTRERPVVIGLGDDPANGQEAMAMTDLFDAIGRCVAPEAWDEA